MTANEDIWSLSCWTRALPQLKSAGYNIAGLWTCDDQLGNQSNAETHNWYAATFGVWNFFKLGLFGITVRFWQLVMFKPMNHRALAKRQSLFYAHTPSPNDAVFVEWVVAQRIDILLIMIPQIIQSPLINAVTIINKHDALLPANRGLHPYFWAALKGDAQAVTFHQVTTKIDAGKILYQAAVIDKAALSSMTAFYVHNLTRYAEGAVRAIESLQGKIQPAITTEVPESYHSLPTRADYLAFKRGGHYIITLSDLWRAFTLVTS